MATREAQAQIADGLRAGRINAETAALALEGHVAVVRLSGRFPAETKLELRRRSGRRFAESEPIVARAKSGADSTVEFSGGGVVAGERYWIVGHVGDEVRAVQCTAKIPAPAKERRERPGTREARPHQRADPDWKVERITPAEVPVSLELPQRAVPAGTPQRSDTPLGTATPIPPGEVSPPPTDLEQAVSLRQEDSDGPQLSDTRTGEQAPVVVDPVRGAEPEKPVNKPVKPEPLSGAALKARAKELDISGRGKMTAAQLRRAVALAEKKNDRG